MVNKFYIGWFSISMVWMVVLWYQVDGAGDQSPGAAAEKTPQCVSHQGSRGLSSAVRELNDELVELPAGSPLRFTAEVFTPLDEELGLAHLVGLGEATHGTAEFFELKHRLFKHLVEVHGHKALGYEFGFADSLALDRYVTTGEGSLDDLLADVSWIQANEEVRALLEWIWEHNRGLPEQEQVRFFGIDSQLDMWNLELHREIFFERFPAVYRRVQPRFDVLEELGRIDYRSITRDEHDRIRSVLDTLAVVVEDSAQGMSRSDAMIAAHLIEALQRSHEFPTARTREATMSAMVTWQPMRCGLLSFSATMRLSASGLTIRTSGPTRTTTVRTVRDRWAFT